MVFHRAFRYSLYWFAVGLLLSACAVGPDYVQPGVNVSPQFKEMRDFCAEKNAQQPTLSVAMKAQIKFADNCSASAWKLAQPQDVLVSDRWWRAYKDDVLNQLMNQLEVDNQNLQVAQAQYQQAHALVQQSRASFFPTISTNAGYTAKSTSNTATSAHSTVARAYNVQLQAAWELDLWGRARRAVEANQATAQARYANIEAVKLSARVALAQNYFQLRIIDLQKQHAQASVASYARTLDITKNKYHSGMAQLADVRSAEVQLSSAQVMTADLEGQRAQLEHAIAVLIGADPSRFNLAPLSHWQAFMPGIPNLLPMALLERRPDVAAAERNVAAANAQVGVAQSAYFPNLNFSAAVGYENTLLTQLLRAPNLFWSLGPTLALTLFDGGARAAQVMQSKANYDQLVANYRQTVLSAIQGVEDNLAVLRVLADELRSQSAAVSAARQAAELTLNQYRAGMVDYSRVALAQIAANSSENTLLGILGRQYLTHAALIAALGGNFSGERVSQ